MMRWKASRVAGDRTHHRVDDEPLYAARFDEVLAFHEPGLAPARDASGAFHIDEHGRPAYAARYRRTFGFYEGFAAVEAREGSHHIGPNGAPAYAARYAWCGNYQGGRCAVRDRESAYLHLDEGGKESYAERWRYAGDYREGHAVVQRADGLHTHVDRAGRPTHGRWFADLDVFHKGYARARTSDGWTHVGRDGEPISKHRFAMVEPFYNGQARVERHDGSLALIDERGEPLVELRRPTVDPLHAVSAELVSFWRCETVFGAVELGLFDRLPFSDDDVDERTRVLLEALGELGLVARDATAWRGTERGALLRSDHPKSLAAAARYWSGPGRRPWRQLGAAMRDPSFRALDPFAEIADDPAGVAAFHAAITTYAEHDYASLAEAIDVGHRRVVDAGGGTGALACALLRARPGLRAEVFDRPEVIALAKAPDDLRARLSFVAGDLFAPWPATADALVLARVLHDWDDERALSILRRARQAMQPGGRLYVVELVRDPDTLGGALLSLHLLLSTGGRERTVAGFERLFVGAGLCLRDVRTIASICSVMVVEAA